jgi:hypothetical protein
MPAKPMPAETGTGFCLSIPLASGTLEFVGHVDWKCAMDYSKKKRKINAQSILIFCPPAWLSPELDLLTIPVSRPFPSAAQTSVRFSHNGVF